MWCGIVAWNLARHGGFAQYPGAARCLQAVALLAVAGWATARYLKKSGRVVAD